MQTHWLPVSPVCKLFTSILPHLQQASKAQEAEWSPVQVRSWVPSDLVPHKVDNIHIMVGKAKSGQSCAFVECLRWSLRFASGEKCRFWRGTGRHKKRKQRLEPHGLWWSLLVLFLAWLMFSSFFLKVAFGDFSHVSGSFLFGMTVSMMRSRWTSRLGCKVLTLHEKYEIRPGRAELFPIRKPEGTSALRIYLQSLL